MKVDFTFSVLSKERGVIRLEGVEKEKEPLKGKK